MLDDEVQAGEVRRGEVDVGDVEGVLVERPDRGALVDVDVRTPSCSHASQVPRRLGVFEGPAAGITSPLGRVQLHPLRPYRSTLAATLEAGVTVPGSQRAVEHELVGMFFGEHGVRSVVLKPSVPLRQVRRLEDRHVDVALLEHVAIISSAS